MSSNLYSAMKSFPNLFVKLSVYQPNTTSSPLSIYLLLLSGLHLDSVVRALKIADIRHNIIY